MDLFQFKDYRLALKSLIEEKRESNKKYSFRYYSNLLETSDTYIKQVIAGRRTLNLDKAKLLTDKLGLNSVESAYFNTLILLSSAKTDELKNYYTEILSNLSSHNPLNYENKNKFKHVFSNSHSWEIYTLLGIKKFRPLINKFHKILKNEVTRLQVNEILNFLLQSKAIVRADDSYKAGDVVVEHDFDTTEVYLKSLKRSINYLTTPAQREELEHFDSFCLAIDEDDFPKIKDILEQSRIQIAKVCSQSKNKNRIAYFNSNFYFASKKIES